MPLCGCQLPFGLRRAIKRAVAQHGEQDVTATSCERDEGSAVALSLTDFAGVRNGTVFIVTLIHKRGQLGAKDLLPDYDPPTDLIAHRAEALERGALHNVARAFSFAALVRKCVPCQKDSSPTG